jgi:pyruvate,orthophosphate dikinase
VFNSWGGKRAVDYRREFKITPAMANGTAVNVVAMVFGNMGDDSATGVGFTRDPGTGENVMYGEYLTNAQGEDVVAGIRTPKPVSALAEEMPDLHRQLVELRNRLESHYKEVQDYEYTIEKGVLYCLQTRNGKMNAQALVRSSVDMVREGLIDKRQALMRIQPEMLEQLLFPHLDPKAKATPVAKGLPASPGAASGIAVFDADRAEKLGRRWGEGHPGAGGNQARRHPRLLRLSQGILTSRGGKTSHAAVVARGMGKPCVAGAEGIHVDVRTRQAIVGDSVPSGEGHDDHHRRHHRQGLPGRGAHDRGRVQRWNWCTLLGWADEAAKLQVMANADTPDRCRPRPQVRRHGHRPVPHRAHVQRRRPAAHRGGNDRRREPSEDRQAALDKLLPIQRADFRRASSRSWRRARSPSACWIRPSTNSCPAPTSLWKNSTS